MKIRNRKNGRRRAKQDRRKKEKVSQKEILREEVKSIPYIIMIIFMLVFHNFASLILQHNSQFSPGCIGTCRQTNKQMGEEIERKHYESIESQVNENRKNKKKRK